jgi:hypothetical protein
MGFRGDSFLPTWKRFCTALALSSDQEGWARVALVDINGQQKRY